MDGQLQKGLLWPRYQPAASLELKGRLASSLRRIDYPKTPKPHKPYILFIKIYKIIYFSDRIH
jgi:hypothetical protein